ncbi:unnamed protein product [Mytilus edulis]|uniref:Uncharacterized protein n=1 Tax=Mytilus edulis TaxID=6550 RepID=A0A8S3R9G2_MYTED|nr:unnamed protein product [Mytilus edulis]
MTEQAALRSESKNLSASRVQTVINSKAMSIGVIDLEENLKSWAWMSYRKATPGGISAKLEDFYLDVNWDGVDFFPQKLAYSSAVKEEPKTHVIFKSVFQNDSVTTWQTHSLKMERQTTATCTSYLTKGCTKGFNVGVTLAAPIEVAEASVGFERGWSIKNAKENVENKMLTWVVQEKFSVPPNSELTVEVGILEKQCSYTFSTSVIINGKVTVDIYNWKNTNNVIMSVMVDIKEMLKKYSAPQVIRKEGNDFVIDMEGTCNFSFGTEQQIRCFFA